MDKIKDLAGKASGKGGSSSSGSSGAGGKDDYVDKGLDQVEKSTGTQKYGKYNEQVTDKGRDFYEKQTGKEVPDKVSN